jgi:hypothetical protein
MNHEGAKMSRRNSDEAQDLLGAELAAWAEEPKQESTYGSYRDLKDQEEAEERLREAHQGRG